jgi:hypothetical protein
VHGFRGPDADQDAQHLQAAGWLRHRGIKAVATLFDGGEVKAGGVCDRLQEVRICSIGIGPGNRRMLVHRQGMKARYEVIGTPNRDWVDSGFTIRWMPLLGNPQDNNFGGWEDHKIMLHKMIETLAISGG